MRIYQTCMQMARTAFWLPQEEPRRRCATGAVKNGDTEAKEDAGAGNVTSVMLTMTAAAAADTVLDCGL